MWREEILGKEWEGEEHHKVEEIQMFRELICKLEMMFKRLKDYCVRHSCQPNARPAIRVGQSNACPAPVFPGWKDS